MQIDEHVEQHLRDAYAGVVAEDLPRMLGPLLELSLADLNHTPGGPRANRLVPCGATYQSPMWTDGAVQSIVDAARRPQWKGRWHPAPR